MATLTETTPTAVSTVGVDLAKFPDGLKTSGQHPPVYSQVRPYSEFPKVITGPTVWKAEDYRENPDLWTHKFTDEEIKEISDASDAFIHNGTPLTGISKVSRRTMTILQKWKLLSTLVDQFPATKALQAPGRSSKGFNRWKRILALQRHSC